MKLKSLYLSLLVLFISTALFAQEKYEQAVVSQETGTALVISIEGKETRMKDLSPRVRNLDLAPLLKELSEMRNDGWEVWNSSVMERGVIYFLRRKLK